MSVRVRGDNSAGPNCRLCGRRLLDHGLTEFCRDDRALAAFASPNAPVVSRPLPDLPIPLATDAEVVTAFRRDWVRVPKASGDDWHGRPWGVMKHRKLGESPCPACRDARNDYKRSLRQRRRYEESRVFPKPLQHGTYAGAQAHKRRKEPICPACKAARNRYELGLRRARFDKQLIRQEPQALPTPL